VKETEEDGCFEPALVDSLLDATMLESKAKAIFELFI
jgi:hypothetical protein